MTNGEKIKQIFPNVQTNEENGHLFVNFFIEGNVNGKKITIMSALGAREEWWNCEYKGGAE